MKIDLDPQIPSGCREVYGALVEAGHKVYFVGGCVRDAILGRKISDVDLATSAEPDEILGLTAEHGWRTVPTGVKYGSISILAEQNQFTVTSFRKDLQSDGRHPSIAFSDDITVDAGRRDFTMNALYASLDGEVIDPLDGLEDLLAGRVRFIGEPRDRIREDYLRMLRFFRFHIHYGGNRAEPDRSSLEAVREMSDRVERLSRERIGQEILRMLEAREPSRGVLPMERVGLLGRILPGSAAVDLPNLERLEWKFNVEPDSLRRLVSLGGCDVAKALRLSRESAKYVKVLSAAKRGFEPPSALGYKLGRQLAADTVLLRAAERNEEPEADFLETVGQAASQVFPLAAEDLMPDYLGPALGKKLAELEKIWVESGFSVDRNALLRIARNCSEPSESP